MVNINPETGIRYGIISANSLHPDLIFDLQMSGKDLHWEDACADLRKSIDRDMDIPAEDKEDEYELQLEDMGDSFQDDEPVHSFNYQGVKGRTTWLGGGLLVWIFESPFMDKFRICSPCVPNCCDCDSPDPNGYEGYDVPPQWRAA